jgi:hypothetical protein
MTTIAIDFPAQRTRRFRRALSLRRARAQRAEPGAGRQAVLQVELAAPDGSRFTAIGGGDTVAEALTFALASAPDGVAWEPVRWTDLYGD